MNEQKRNPPTWRWERRLCRRAGVTMLAAAMLAALAVVPARAAGSCPGTYITSALEEIPQSTTVGIDPRERTPISIAAYARFLAGMQAAGARVQENSDLRLRLVFSVIQGMTSTTSEAPAGVEAAHRIESTNSGYRGRPSWRVPNISAEPHRGGPGPGQTGCRDQAGGG